MGPPYEYSMRIVRRALVYSSAILTYMDHAEHPHHPPRGPFSTNRKFVSTAIAVVLLSAGFYWYQVRPMNIREACAIDSSRRAFVGNTAEGDVKGLDRIRIQNESFESYYNL